MRKLKINLFQVIPCIFMVGLIACSPQTKNPEPSSTPKVYQDAPFVQETHDAYKISNNPADNEVRSIAVDKESNVWIATASGIFCKKSGSREWKPVISGEDHGPAY